MTVQQVAERLGISKKTVWRLRDAGKLPCVRVKPTIVRWREADVDRYERQLRD
jgi:excisionase family DNA binding protein